MRRLSIEVPDTLHQQIKARASLEGLSMRAYILQRLEWTDTAESESASSPPRSVQTSTPAPGSMRELLEARPWHGEKTQAEIDAQIAEERAAWSER